MSVPVRQLLETLCPLHLSALGDVTARKIETPSHRWLHTAGQGGEGWAGQNLWSIYRWARGTPVQNG